MNEDLVKYSHSVVRIWGHFSLKTKYAHNVFENHPEFREASEKMILEIFDEINMEVDTYGFDDNHFHAIIDLGLWNLPDLCKKLKGITGRKLLNQFPEIKKKYFWGSGLWSRAKYFYSIGRNKASVQKYVAKQKFFRNNLLNQQTTLTSFAS